jgi:hypothetical protein
VATSQLKAKKRRVDGVPVVKIEPSYYFSHDEAARALAIIYGAEPLRTGIHTLRDGLMRAAVQGVLARDPEPPATAITAYRTLLRKLDVFPAKAKRQRMLRELREAQRQHRQSDRGNRRTAPKVDGHPALWAKHIREDDDAPVVKIEVPHYLDLDQAATALAIIYPTRDTPLRSENALRLGLQDAARQRVLARRKPAAAPELVSTYRDILLAEKVF